MMIPYTLERDGSLGMHVHSGRRLGHGDLQLEAGDDMDPETQETGASQGTAQEVSIGGQSHPGKKKRKRGATTCHIDGLCVLSCGRALSWSPGNPAP